MRKKLFQPYYFLLIFLLPAYNSFAQQATLKGKVILPVNETAENISVTLKGTSIGTITNPEGVYEIVNIKPGPYVLKISAVGYATKERSILLKSGDELTEDFNMTRSSEELREVTVNGVKSNAFTRKESQQVSRMNLKNLENAQVYTSITGELLKEQVVTNFNDALKNAPGLTQLWVSTGRGGDGAGYFSLRGFAVQPTMTNGLPGLTNGSPDPANIERIEVIKGPSGTLFGSNLISYGGLINVTTKKPYDYLGGEFSYTAGSYGLNRITADVNAPVNNARTLNVRVNAAYHNEDSFQDAGFRKSLFVAPSLSYKASERLLFLINTEIMSAESTNPTMLFLDRNAPLRVKNTNELRYDSKRSYTSNELTLETPSFNLQAQLIYKLSEQWSSQTVLSRSHSRSKGYYSYLYETTQYIPAITDGVVLGRYFNHQNATSLTTDIQQNFIGDFKIGKLRNRIVGGLDYFNRTNTDNGTNYVVNGSIYIGNDPLTTVNANVFGITDPALFLTNGDNGVLSEAGSAALLATAGVSASKTKQEVYSAYVSDVLNITPALSAMASLRIDRFISAGDILTKDDDFNQTAFSPKFGLVFQPIIDKVSVFANYMNGFLNVAPGTDILPDGVRLPRTYQPEKANQLEFGTKLNLFKDRLFATLSYYDTKVENMAYTVYGATTQISYQDGAQENKGFEAEIVANPINGLNISMGYSYNDALLTSGDPDFVGHRPESAGPQNLANLWASYKFSGKLNGFGLGFGGNHASENKIMNRTKAGVFTLPDYTMINASAFYGIENYQLTIKVNNITNKQAYDGWSTIHPLAPRNVSANFSYKF